MAPVEWEAPTRLCTPVPLPACGPQQSSGLLLAGLRRSQVLPVSVAHLHHRKARLPLGEVVGRQDSWRLKGGHT